MLIIGLSGAAESGKNTFATMLVEHAHANGLRVVEDAFARDMKLMLEKLDPCIEDEYGYAHCLSDELEKFEDLPWNERWDNAKKHPEVRRLLQRIGTEAGRGVLGDDIWVRRVEARMWDAAAAGTDVFIVTDARFPDEQSMLKNNKARLIHIERDVENSLGQNNAHASENSLDDSMVDHVIHNEGSLDDLSDVARSVIESYLSERS